VVIDVVTHKNALIFATV